MVYDLRTIDADFRRILGDAYRPLCSMFPQSRHWVSSSAVGNADVEAEALIGWAGATAWAVKYEEAPNDMLDMVARREDFESLESLHAAIVAWEKRR